MNTAEQFLNIIKKASLEAVENSTPANIILGVVETEKPLSIRIDQKIVLTEEFLILARDVTEYTYDMTVNHTTEIALNVETSHSHTYKGETELDEPGTHNHIYSGITDPVSFGNLSHRHGYVGRWTYIVHNQLLTGEKVILMRFAGGQKYVVLDRVGE